MQSFLPLSIILAASAIAELEEAQAQEISAPSGLTWAKDFTFFKFENIENNRVIYGERT